MVNEGALKQWVNSKQSWCLLGALISKIQRGVIVSLFYTVPLNLQKSYKINHYLVYMGKKAVKYTTQRPYWNSSLMYLK